MFTASFRKEGKGVVCDGLRLANGKTVASSGTNLFTITLADGTTYDSQSLTCTPLAEVRLPVNKKHPQLARRLPGKAVGCTFTTPDKALEIKWRAVLRNGSHYLRQELEVKATQDTHFAYLPPLQYKIQQGGEPELSGNTTHGRVVVNDLIFCGLETPMSVMSAGGAEEEDSSGWDPGSWSSDSFSGTFNVPASLEAKYGAAYAEIQCHREKTDNAPAQDTGCPPHGHQ